MHSPDSINVGDPSLAGRVAIAAVVSTFALGGLAGSLDGMFWWPHGSSTLGVLFLIGSPFFGAVVARGLLTDARYVYVGIVALLALVGECGALLWRPWNPSFWYPPAPNAAWVASWTFAPALVGTLLRRASPRRAWQGTAWLAVLLVLLFLLVHLARSVLLSY